MYNSAKNIIQNIVKATMVHGFRDVAYEFNSSRLNCFQYLIFKLLVFVRLLKINLVKFRNKLSLT